MKTIELNSSVKTEDAPRLTKQDHKILDLLRAGKVSTRQMANIACQYNARIYEIRRYLEHKEGKTVKLIKKDGNGNNWYEIRNISDGLF